MPPKTSPSPLRQALRLTKGLTPRQRLRAWRLWRRLNREARQRQLIA